MSRTRQVDGFQLLSGLISVVAGPLMLATGTLPGWSIVITVAGAIVLWAQWRIVNDERDATSTDAREPLDDQPGTANYVFDEDTTRARRLEDLTDPRRPAAIQEPSQTVRPTTTPRSVS
jgi:hypothetical protein